MVRKEYEMPLINVVVLQRNVLTTLSVEPELEKILGDTIAD